MLRLNGQAHSDSNVELFLWRLEEQALKISSPWEPIPGGRLIVDMLWPQLCGAWRSKEEWAGCRELDSDVEHKWVEAKQCLNVPRQLSKSGIVALQALKGLDGRGLSLAALHAFWCVISRLKSNIFMSWLQNANADLLDAGDPDSHAAQSGILSALDGIQLRQPARDCLPLSSVARVPPGGSTCVIGAYDRIVTSGLSSSPAWLERRPHFSLMNEWSLPPH